MSAAQWTTPADLRTQVERLWSSGRLLNGEALFPLELKLRRPDSRALSERFEEVRAWIRDLESESAFRIEWTEVDHRILGRNRVPVRVMVAERAEALRFIGRAEDAARFHAIEARTLERLPELRDWLLRRPMVALENAAEWDRVLDVVEWLRDHPRCNLYLRQFDIAGVDTKFIEARKPLLLELLEIAMAPAPVAPGPRYFERRYGIATKPVQVRFRILDPRLAIGGLTDIAAPDAQLAKLKLPARCVFVTENEVNGLAFPDVPESIVIFGLGYGLERLAEIAWLRGVALHYWGDIDTYGFHMLDRLRASFPHAESFLMDRATLLDHRAMWVQEARLYGGALDRLTPAELTLYDELRDGRYGDRVRLEQERIRFGCVERAVQSIAALLHLE